MYRPYRMIMGVALPVALMSTTALADLAPADVWGDWRTYMQGMGYTIDATESVNGSDLTVSDIVLTVAMPDAAAAMSMSIGTVTFVQNGDGSVAVVMPEVMPLALNVTPNGNDEKPVTATLNYTQTGHAMTASGTSDKITYTYAAATFGLALSQVQVGDETYGADNAMLSVTGTDASSSSTMTIGTLRDYQQAGTIGSLQYDLLIKNPEEPVVVKVNGSLTDMSFDSGGTIPIGLPNDGNMAAMLQAGFDIAGRLSYGSGSTNMDVADPENGNFALVSSSTGGSLGIEMGAGGLGYTGSQKNLAVTVNAAALPFPVELSMAEGGFNLSVPVTKSDAPQDFAFGFKMADFKMSDMIWGMFDPTAQLPRDPATLIVDLSGKARLFVDYLDPAAAAKMVNDMPGEIQSLNIRTLLLDAVGVRLEGTGDVTFDNSDLTTLPGMPKPVGAVDLSLAGANALLDKLVAMGILPEDQAMGGRMMMGMFGVPGDAPDTIKSRVEFTQNGQILANGQRIK